MDFCEATTSKLGQQSCSTGDRSPQKTIPKAGLWTCEFSKHQIRLLRNSEGTKRSIEKEVLFSGERCFCSGQKDVLGFGTAKPFSEGFYMSSSSGATFRFSISLKLQNIPDILEIKGRRIFLFFVSRRIASRIHETSNLEKALMLNFRGIQRLST